MSRHGYTEDADPEGLNLYRGRLTRSINGKRGQKALRDLLAALEAMPEKKLVSSVFRSKDGGHCALGVLAAARGVEDKMPTLIHPSDYDNDPNFVEPEGALDSEYDSAEICDTCSAALDIAPCLAAEIMYENDWDHHMTPEYRWKYIRSWVSRRIKSLEGVRS